ncbi:hypothetical protein [Clostridium coskatii]|uniref:hypothetical protein n=1 Tax=Clostridium coskatii TaxID=1705578 RepID=UPI0007BF5E40|nr:hypothetical protein [Clostridium coskatii]
MRKVKKYIKKPILEGQTYPKSLLMLQLHKRYFVAAYKAYTPVVYDSILEKFPVLLWIASAFTKCLQFILRLQQLELILI